MPKLIDLVGKKIGHLTVIRFGTIRPNPSVGNRYYWLCRCECGKEIEADGCCLRRGSAISCGCRKKPVRRKDGCGETHGMSNHPLYEVWNGIKQRCYNANSDCYADYGGRGIRMCDDWRESFAAFYACMGERPSPVHTIERKDNDGNYEPSNCVWATRAEQNENTRQTRLITFNGVTLSLSKWAKRIGIERTSLRARLDRFGWTVERALTTPGGKQNQSQCANPNR